MLAGGGRGGAHHEESSGGAQTSVQDADRGWGELRNPRTHRRARSWAARMWTIVPGRCRASAWPGRDHLTRQPKSELEGLLNTPRSERQISAANPNDEASCRVTSAPPSSASSSEPLEPRTQHRPRRWHRQQQTPLALVGLRRAAAMWNMAVLTSHAVFADASSFGGRARDPRMLVGVGPCPDLRVCADPLSILDVYSRPAEAKSQKPADKDRAKQTETHRQ